MTPQNSCALAACLLVCAVGVASADGARAAKFRVLHTFKDHRDGANPLGGLMQDQAGNLYGTTIQGGAHENGNVFKLAKDGGQTTLYSFAGGSDGSKPEAGVIADAAGNLYGTTYFGGMGCDCGTVFKLAPNGAETVLHAFTAGQDGANPYAGLVLDGAGNLYGTTTSGGASDNGTVFRIAPDNTETVLHSFTGGNDGELPYAGLILGKNGNLYGTAIGGGKHGFGVVFEMTPAGAETVLYAFRGGQDAEYPQGGVIADKAGNLYGTTRGGGLGHGTVFKLEADRQEMVLYAFTGGADGSEPYAGLAADRAGNLYGATVAGGEDQDYGTVFEIGANGTFTLLHTFTNGHDGEYPEAGVITGTAHRLFGVAYAGGRQDWGTVFTLTH